MATFRPPYGTPKQHVIAPAQHLGYRFLVARLVDGGMDADYIRRACSDAHAEGVPKDAVTCENGVWKTRAQLPRNRYTTLLDSYAAALTKYEQELKAERST